MEIDDLTTEEKERLIKEGWTVVETSEDSSVDIEEEDVPYEEENVDHQEETIFNGKEEDHPQNDKPKEEVPKNSEPTAKSSVSENENQPVVIKLKKGFNEHQISLFVSTIDKTLTEMKPIDVVVITEEWDSDVRPYPCIPAAKNLFRKYIEKGLLASLLNKGYYKTAHEIYCVGYVKGKEHKGRIEFKNIEKSHFEQIVIKSLENFVPYDEQKLQGSWNGENKLVVKGKNETIIAENRNYVVKEQNAK